MPNDLGADKLVINDEYGPRWIIIGDAVTPHPDHTHVFGWFGRRCKICGKTRKQLSKESK